MKLCQSEHILGFEIWELRKPWHVCKILQLAKNSPSLCIYIYKLGMGHLGDVYIASILPSTGNIFCKHSLVTFHPSIWVSPTILQFHSQEPLHPMEIWREKLVSLGTFHTNIVCTAIHSSALATTDVKPRQWSFKPNPGEKGDNIIFFLLQIVQMTRKLLKPGEVRLMTGILKLRGIAYSKEKDQTGRGGVGGAL